MKFQNLLFYNFSVKTAWKAWEMGDDSVSNPGHRDCLGCWHSALSPFAVRVLSVFQQGLWAELIQSTQCMCVKLIIFWL